MNVIVANIEDAIVTDLIADAGFDHTTTKAKDYVQAQVFDNIPAGFSNLAGALGTLFNPPENAGTTDGRIDWQKIHAKVADGKGTFVS